VRVSLLRVDGAEALRAGLVSHRSGHLAPTGTSGAIARGMGRSYGDAAQLRGGLVIDTVKLKRFELDRHQGIVTAQAGVTIAQLLDALVPERWMLPVVPGTQHVTVGGAIASDVHGKNHLTAGTFGDHLRGLGLMTAAGEVLELKPGSDDGLFEATLGGMGLTGVILWARIALERPAGPLLSVDTDRVDDLDDALAALCAGGGQYRIAWLDLLGSRSGRGIVTRADHVDGVDSAMLARGRSTVRARATIPPGWPGGLLRASTVRSFNELRFRRAPRCERHRAEGFGTHMFPLDALDAWPRLYGRPGLLQYQFAVPCGREHVMQMVIQLLRRAHIPCFLATLKDLGPANDAPLSFPLAGWTLALDLPRAARELDASLDACDELVADAGGRVYLTKDARMRPQAVTAMYPRLEEWRTVRDRADPGGLWRSDLALRTGLVSAEPR
jgi:decaprenylphospho-beta-D-ribofuranose 2-oxidase